MKKILIVRTEAAKDVANDFGIKFDKVLWFKQTPEKKIGYPKFIENVLLENKENEIYFIDSILILFRIKDKVLDDSNLTILQTRPALGFHIPEKNDQFKKYHGKWPKFIQWVIVKQGNRKSKSSFLNLIAISSEEVEVFEKNGYHFKKTSIKK